jgi:hypothetical protein
LQGPYCSVCNVSDGSRYYDALSSACVPCAGGAHSALRRGPALAALAALTALVSVLLWARFHPRRDVPSRGREGGGREGGGIEAKGARALSRLSAQRTLRPKAKQLLGFYQVAACLLLTYLLLSYLLTSLLTSLLRSYSLTD